MTTHGAVYHIGPFGPDRRPWSVYRSGATRRSGYFETEEDALAWAKVRSWVMYRHRSDGTVIERIENTNG